MVVHGWLGQDTRGSYNIRFKTQTKSLNVPWHLDMAHEWASVYGIKHIDALERVGHD